MVSSCIRTGATAYIPTSVLDVGYEGCMQVCHIPSGAFRRGRGRCSPYRGVQSAAQCHRVFRKLHGTSCPRSDSPRYPCGQCLRPPRHKFKIFLYNTQQKVNQTYKFLVPHFSSIHGEILVLCSRINTMHWIPDPFGGFLAHKQPARFYLEISLNFSAHCLESTFECYV